MITCNCFNKNDKVYWLGNSVKTLDTRVWLMQWIVKLDENKINVYMKTPFKLIDEKQTYTTRLMTIK